MKIRAIIKIDGSAFDFSTRFSQLSLRQLVGGHHSCDISIDLNLTSGALNARAAEWVGKKLSVEIDKVEENRYDLLPQLVQTFEGFVTGVALHRHYAGNQIVIRGKSPTVALDSGPHVRSFAEKTLEEIANEIMGAYGSTFSSGNHIEPGFSDTLPYIVQYKESDWNFLGRLAARYGEWLYYDGQKLHFVDIPAESDAISLSYASDLLHLSCVVKAVPSGFKLLGYDYREHEPLEEEADFGSDAGSSDLAQTIMDNSASTIFPNNPELYIHQTIDADELTNMVERREKAHVNDMIQLSGSSRNPKLRVGSTIYIDDTDWFEEEYGMYRIINVTHEVSHGGNYTNHFEAIPVEVTVPNFTHATDPPFCENQVGEVVKVDDDKKLGRIKVKLGWQKNATEADLPWIRVASPYTGGNKGLYFLPEVGDQVLVSFEQQHPEKPFVLTGMYHNEAKPEHHHPQNDLKGIKTRGQNSILFNDKAKSESIKLHSPKSISINAGTSVNISAGSSIRLSTGKEGKITIDAGENGEVTIIAKKIVIKGMQDEHIVLQNNTAVINGGETTAITAKNVGINGESGVSIEGGKTAINGTSGVSISGATVKLNS